MKRLPLPIMLLLATTACAAGIGSYPSLAPRAAENKGFEEPAAPEPMPVPADPALDTQISEAQHALADGAAAFDAAAGRTEKATRAPGASIAGSDAWLDAQTALAELDSIRAGNLDQVTSLETAAADRAQALRQDYPALREAIEAAQAVLTAETARIDTLQSKLAPR